MEWNFVFFFNSVLLGVGLAMDAFSVSLANGLNICTVSGSNADDWLDLRTYNS